MAGHSLHPAGALLLSPAEKERLGAFFKSWLMVKSSEPECDRKPPVSSVGERMRCRTSLPLGPSRGRCGPVSAGYKKL